jgi:hypothetical protein
MFFMPSKLSLILSLSKDAGIAVPAMTKYTV